MPNKHFEKPATPGKQKEEEKREKEEEEKKLEELKHIELMIKKKQNLYMDFFVNF